MGAGCVLPNARHLQCDSDGDATRPLNVERLADRWHLRNDVERAEEIGVRFGDSKRKAEGRAGERIRQTECTDKLLHEIAVRHDVALDALSAMRGRRPLLLDVAVFVAFAVLIRAALRSMFGALDERLGDSRGAWVATTAVLILVMSVVGTFALNLFGYGVEIVRLWDGHISYRAGRLPWEQHPFAVGLGLMILSVAVSLTRRRSEP